MAPTDGYLSTTAVTVGTLTYVLCNTGYSLFGLSPLACETGGTWNDVVGVCKKGMLLCRFIIAIVQFKYFYYYKFLITKTSDSVGHLHTRQVTRF